MTANDPVHLDIPLRPTGVDAFITPRSRPDLYPGTRPTWSFCFTNRRIVPLLVGPDGIAVLDEGVTTTKLDTLVRNTMGWGLGELFAVLAVGSNACPARLADPDKYGSGQTVAIPVLRGWVDGVVSVYCSRRTSYGSIPTTIAGLPGARSRLWVTLLSSEELQRMDESEGRGSRYQLVEIPNARLHVDGGLSIGPLSAYFESRGLVAPDSERPIRLACFEATGSPLSAMNQDDAQAYVENFTCQSNDRQDGLPSTALDLPIGAEILPTGTVPSERVRLFWTEREPLW